ncbi:MAG: hypothetical protein JNM36_04525 [Chitinophagales bacterium]|nr:hypothetical protein [Chitinophagales bacterium]
MMTHTHKLSIFFIALLITSHIFAQNTAPDSVKQKTPQKVVMNKGFRISTGFSTLFNSKYHYSPIQSNSFGFFFTEITKPFSITFEGSLDKKGGINRPIPVDVALINANGGFVINERDTKFILWYVSLSVLPTYRFSDNKYSFAVGLSMSSLFATEMRNPPPNALLYTSIHPKLDFNLIGSYQYIFIEKPFFYMQLDTRITYGLLKVYNEFTNNPTSFRQATAQAGLSFVWK